MCCSIKHITIAAEGPKRERECRIDGCEAVQQGLLPMTASGVESAIHQLCLGRHEAGIRSPPA